MNEKSTGNTVLVCKYLISSDEFKEILREKLLYGREAVWERINRLGERVEEIIKKEQIRIVNKEVWIDFYNHIIWPDFARAKVTRIHSLEGFDQKKYILENQLIEGLQNTLPMCDEIDSRKWFLEKYLYERSFFLCEKKTTFFWGIKPLLLFYDLSDGMTTSSVGETAVKFAFTVARFESMKNKWDVLFHLLIKFELCPEELSDDLKEIFFSLCTMSRKGYLVYKKEYNNDKRGINLKMEDFVQDIIDNLDNDSLENTRFRFVNIIKEMYQQKNIRGGDMEDIKNKLLCCEKMRADIEPYEEKILTDPNRGHWDLWEKQQVKGEYTVQLDEAFYARNPKCDINEEGVIAIDFGTKSTIVVYQSDIEHSLPMGIGDGNLSEGPTPMRYENPTVMHFIDVETFLQKYNEKQGRPDTAWNDLTISHTAMEQFKTSKSEEYYEYLHQIKQWAGQREKQFRIRTHSGESILLPAFLDLDDKDINPIELYAYYIGLYINNMRKGHGIFLDYYLSFPVTYEVKIREKIIESFDRGLRKSLPETILKDEEIMSRFRVNGDISEPAAYAVCALQEYGFEPSEDEEIFYGIFDFGGGTTDFDFGLWKESKKKRYDYTIENFGAGGDEFLGGENLLEMLAFHIFKKNQDMMRQKGYTFTLAPKCTEFVGSDALLSDSQEAEKNMFNLMSALRPFWEESSDYLNIAKSFDDMSMKEQIDHIYFMGRNNLSNETFAKLESNLEDIIFAAGGEKIHYTVPDNVSPYILPNTGTFDTSELKNIVEKYSIDSDIRLQDDEVILKVDLFDKEGIDHANEPIAVSRSEIASFIEEKIREGVKNFFAALLLSYRNDKVKKPTTVNILLAGNSCKSPIVKKVFEEQIDEQRNNIKEDLNIQGEVGKLFEIFPPLGTPDAYRKMEERGISYTKDDFERPTGKTGVAFGLIQCRDGGSIERISNADVSSEIPFQFFIGWRTKRKFEIFRGSNKPTKYLGKPDYDEWYRFIEADASTFYLYYTTLPECVNGNLNIEGNAAVKRLKCAIDVIDENANVYIRATGPHTIQYTVSSGDDVEKCRKGEIYTKELG